MKMMVFQISFYQEIKNSNKDRIQEEKANAGKRIDKIQVKQRYNDGD